jgi:L-ribulokinase
MLVAPPKDMEGKLVKGICGQVDGSVIPGMIGLEAGQSAFGDTYAWFKKILSWPVHNLLMASDIIDQPTKEKLSREISDKMIPELTRQAMDLPIDEKSEVAIDWLNGRRTPDANQLLKGALSGMNLGSNAPHLFKAWVEGTCFGAKAIVERFDEEGVPVKGLIGLGGVAKKSPYIMQVMADVMNMPIRIHQSDQTCATGAAMFAATAAGIYTNVEEAMNAMGQGFAVTYNPNKSVVDIYKKRYERYKALCSFLDKKEVNVSEYAQ